MNIYERKLFFVNFFFVHDKNVQINDWSSTSKHQFRPLLISFYLKKIDLSHLLFRHMHCFRPSTHFNKTQHFQFYRIYIILFYVRTFKQYIKEMPHKATPPFDQMFNFFLKLFILFFNHFQINCYELNE